MTERQAQELIEAVKYGNSSADWFYGITTVLLVLLLIAVWLHR